MMIKTTPKKTKVRKNNHHLLIKWIDVAKVLQNHLQHLPHEDEEDQEESSHQKKKRVMMMKRTFRKVKKIRRVIVIKGKNGKTGASCVKKLVACFAVMDALKSHTWHA